MEGSTTLEKAKNIMGLNMLGPDDLLKLNSIKGLLNINLLSSDKVKNVPFSEDFLLKIKDSHILVLIIPESPNNVKLSFNIFRERFGIDPEINEPCFYNQDWYLNEPFYLNSKLELKWLIIQKNISENSRGLTPSNFEISQSCSALVYTYVFFMWYLCKNIILWQNDYIWCNDFDSNGDQIYIGRYFDPQKISKNGFSIHRHLKIKNNYGVLTSVN